MRKSDIVIMPEYFDRYIELAADEDIVKALTVSLEELQHAPLDTWRALGDRAYAEGKWTIKDILQHLIDTERVFMYRITAIARGDKQHMLPYDEEVFAKAAQASSRAIDDLLEELTLIRKATVLFFRYCPDDLLLQQGYAYNGAQYGPLALGFMLAGHQRWHFRILENKYYPMI